MAACFRKSPDSTYAQDKPSVTSSESGTEGITRILSCLAERTLDLRASSLSGSEQIEITATHRRSGALFERAWASGVPELKRFIRRNRQALFALHVTAKPSIARRLCAALGAPSLYTSSHSGERLRISESAAAGARREITILAEPETYAWRGVTIRFPRDPWQRASIRDALIILTVRPAAIGKVKARPLCETSTQLSLPL